jgi:hypothetical protein
VHSFLSPERLLTVGVLLLVATVFLNVSSRNPPGFYRDEAAIAYNAYTLETSGKDEYGARLPLFIKSFGDYKSPLYVYLLAAVFRVTGPSAHVAEVFSAVLGLAAVYVLTYVAFLVTRRLKLALVVALLAGLSPYLFEISRLVFEVAGEPLLIALFLLTLRRASTGRWRTRHSVLLALLLAAMVYDYQAGRVFGVLFAVGLALFYGRGRGRRIAELWAVFLASLVPFAVYWEVHPGALSARYETVTWLRGLGWWQVVVRYPRHYLENINLWDWVAHGDSVVRHHVPGAGSLFFVEVLLALAGAVIVLVRRRGDPWYRFLLYALLVSPVAASLTIGATQSLRLIVLPIVLPLLAVPALEGIGAMAQPRRAVLVGALAVAFVAEAVHWQIVFHRNGPKRQGEFEAQIQPVIAAAFRHGGTVYAYRVNHAEYADSLFFGAVAGRPRSSIVILEDGQRPPPRSLVVGWTGECPTCAPVATDGLFEAYLTR